MQANAGEDSDSGRRRWPQAVAVALVVALAAAAIIAWAVSSGSGGTGRGTTDFARLKNAPPRLAALYRRGDAVIEGDTAAVQAQLDRLRGFPVVVNAWASWCGPCREEFPLFQRASASLGTRVAFLGLDTADQQPAARTFLDEEPLPYPSFTSSGWDLADTYAPGIRGLPKTAYYDARGKRVYVHQGPYSNLRELEADIHRYAL